MRRQPFARLVTVLHPVRVREHTQDTDTALHACDQLQVDTQSDWSVVGLALPLQQCQ